MRTYTKKERNMYLLGLLGQNMIYNIIATGMAFYFQSVINTHAINMVLYHNTSLLSKCSCEKNMALTTSFLLLHHALLFLLRGEKYVPVCLS